MKTIKETAKDYFKERPKTTSSLYDFKVDLPEHYDNTKGSLYAFAEHHKLNAWEFDVIKRIVRCRKKGQFMEDINKTIVVLELYKKEKI